MSYRPPTRPARIASEPRARFNWPLTDDELTQHRQYSRESSERDPEFGAPGSRSGEPFAMDGSLSTDGLTVFPPEMDALSLFPSEIPSVPQKTSQTPSGSGLDILGERPAAPFPLPEPLRAACSPPQSRTPRDDSQARDDGDDLAHARTETDSTAGIAVSPSSTALHLPGPGGLAGEIAHLQALIGELTQPIEWGIPNVSGR
jgi:hypothetical protein